jgi:hypothetical protein
MDNLLKLSFPPNFGFLLLTPRIKGLFALKPPRQSSRQAVKIGRLGEAPAPGNLARLQSKQDKENKEYHNCISKKFENKHYNLHFFPLRSRVPIFPYHMDPLGWAFFILTQK